MTYDELASSLARMDVSMDAAEAHGWLCGALCTRDRYGAKEWLAELAADGEAGAPEAALGKLPEQLRDALRSPDFEFEPLLPPEEAPLAERVAALAAWCGGFLSGFGRGAPDPALARSGEVGEYLADLGEISRAGLDAGRSTDENEGDFAELFEFVRAGAQLTYDELAGSRADAAG